MAGASSDAATPKRKLGPVRPVGHPGLEPGLVEVGKNDVLVGTGTGPVRLGRVKPFGKKEMEAADWARGVRLEPGTRLGGPAA